MSQAPKLFKLNTTSVCLIRDLLMHMIIRYGDWILLNQITYDICYGFFPVMPILIHFLSHLA